MANLVDIRAVGPPRHRKTRRVGSDQVTPDVVGDQTAPGDRPAKRAQVLVLHSQYRKVHRDLSCVRVIAASAIVAGLLLGTAPLALAQVGQLLASVPVAFAQAEPLPENLGTATVDSSRESPLTDSVLQHRLDTHTTGTSMISWTGTSQALRCSYGMLFEGSTRSCEAA